MTTVPWMRHCGDWPTARLKHACLWSGSSSCSSNCPVFVPSQHLLVFVQETKLSNYAAEMCSGTVLNCTAIEVWQARKAEYPLLVPWMRHCGDWPTARLKHACLWSGSSSCSSSCPVFVPSQHLLVLVQETKLSNYAAEMCSDTVLN